MKRFFLFLFLIPLVQAASLGIFPAELAFTNLTEEEQNQTLFLINGPEQTKVTLQASGKELTEHLFLSEEELTLAPLEQRQIEVSAKGPLSNKTRSGLLVARIEREGNLDSALAVKISLETEEAIKSETETYPSLTGFATKETLEHNDSKTVILIGLGVLLLLGIAVYASRRHTRHNPTSSFIRKKQHTTTKYPMKKRRKQRGTSFLYLFRGGGDNVRKTQ